jgi:SAM-dependent methyltransferase
MAANLYDQVPYVNKPYAKTHPDHLAVLGRLHGMNPPAVETARVLDLGASEGGNVIPMAIELPQAQFTGIDLAGEPVRRGQRLIRELGLSNIRLLQMDLMDLGAEFGEFDYIVAHGLYAWTPAAVRDKILAIARANLSPNGIAFVSYNCLPGAHIRRVLREAMLYHAEGAQHPAEQLERARAMLGLLAAGRPAPEEFDRAFASEAESLSKRGDDSLLHDYLSETYQPVYLREFVAHAARHRLRYLADTGTSELANPNLKPEVLSAVDRFSTDRIAREQYLDILRLRPFRRSLVCRAEVPVEDEWRPERAAGLFAACTARETGEGKFELPSGVTVTTNHPRIIALLRKWIAAWPEAEPVTADEAGSALTLFRGGAIELRTWPGLAVRAGGQPVASPLARLQVRRGGQEVTTLRHRSLPIPDERVLRLVGLLDGTRDRAALAREIAALPEEIEDWLARLGRHGVLMA